MFDFFSDKLKKIPPEYRRWSALGILSALLLALPIMVWGLTTGRFEIRKRAVTGEPTPTPILTVTPIPTPTVYPIIGERKILVIMFNFQDQPDLKPFSKEEVNLAFFTGTNSLNSYYKEFSFNQLWFTGEAVGWYTIPYNTSCSWDENMRQILLEKVKADGVDVNDYSHLIYLKPYVDRCTSTASLGGNPSEMYLVGTLNSSLLIHEMGHNLTLGYAASLSCGNKAIDSYSNCRVNYYGDEFSPQGAMATFHHNAFHKLSIGWISPSKVQEVTTTGNYTIYPIETAGSGTQVLKIRKPDTNEYYFLEYRRPIGFDSNLPQEITSGALIHIGFYSYDSNSPSCRMVNCPGYSTNTYLIDTHPETQNDFRDAALNNGITFYDEINHISITQINHDQNSVTVSINLFSTPTPIPTPSGCRQSCDNDNNCQRGLKCGTPCPPGMYCPQVMLCYNPECPYEADCICPVMSPTPTPACSSEGGPCGYGFYGQFLGECCPGLVCHAFPDGGICERQLIPTPTPTPTNKVLRFKLKFKGVTSRPSDDNNKRVQVYATSWDGAFHFGSSTNKKEVLLKVDDEGVYYGQIQIESFYFNRHYRLRIKGPKHLQEVFPDVLFDPNQEIDLTGKPLRPGDLNFDGVLDTTDLKEVNKRIFSNNPADIEFADVNFDKKVDIVDRTLILNTLSVQYDLE